MIKGIYQFFIAHVGIDVILLSKHEIFKLKETLQLKILICVLSLYQIKKMCVFIF